MKYSLRASWGWLSKKLRTQFGIGIIAVVPIGATIWILYWIFITLDYVLQPLIKVIWGHTVTGIGFVIMIALIYLVGVIASNVVGKRLIRYGESVLPWMPIVRQLYTGIKQVLESFSTPRGTGLMQPVIIEFPRKGMRVIGFITNELCDEPGRKLFTVFIPTSPNPTSGFLQIVGEDEIIRTDISVENALKMIVSAGRVSPKEVVDNLSAHS
ncbi:DUF502 domain-containing protein [Chloroflexota bacterium]